MSPHNKIVTFGKIPAAVVEAVKADVEVAEQEVKALTETEEAVTELAMFLLDNASKIQNFVCGIAVDVQTVEADEMDMEFHLITSPIDARDYALALRLFEDGFKRRLGGVIEE